jgi:hypothetical protein
MRLFSWLFVIFLIAATGLYGASVPTTPQQFTLSSENSSGTDLSFTLPDFQIQTEQRGEVTFQRILSPGAAVTMQAGYPELPVFSTTIILPPTGGVQVSLVDSDEYVIPDCRPVPSTGFCYDGEPGNEAPNEGFYTRGAPYPEQAVVISEPAIMRDVRVATVTVSPFTYNPGDNSLRVRSRCSVRVEYTGGRGPNEITRERPISRAFEPFYRSLINYRQSRDEAPDYQRPCIVFLCLNNNQLLPLVQQMADWKRTKGFETHIKTYNATPSSSTMISFLEQAYNSWTNPPEYAVIVGDVTGSFAMPCCYETVSGFSGASDHQFAQLDGQDILPELFVGRISIESITDFQTYLAKMNIYEREVNMTTPGMYNHTLLAGDISSSGTSCVQTMEYIRDCILYRDPTHTFSEQLGSVSPAAINQAINDGSLHFAYRGYIGVSGWTNTNINALTNVNRLVNSVIITCDTGAYNDYGGASRIEQMIRLGTPTAPKGGISAIGMSTSHTHTQFNNILETGIYYGLYSDGMNDMGSALMRGKLALYEAYQNVNASMVETFSYWCNMMGDPSCQMWRTIPLPLTVNYPAPIPTGQSYIDVTVHDNDGNAIPDAWVTVRATSPDTLYSGFTGPMGSITLNVPPSAATLSLTVSKPDYIPHLGTFTHSTQGTTNCEDVSYDDDNLNGTQGNNNSQPNPAEIVGLSPGLRNYDTTARTGVTGTLSSDDPFLTITGSQASFGDIQPQETVFSTTDFLVQIQPDAPDRHVADLTLHLTDSSASTWDTRFWITIRGCDLDPETYSITDPNSNGLDPNETAQLWIPLVNHGQCAIPGVTATLRTTSNKVSVDDSLATYGDIAIGQSNQGEGFTISGQTNLIRGMTIPFTLELSNTSGYAETEEFSIVAGTPTVVDPLGPDDGGYLCYDDGDIGFIDCPTYEWIEIDPTFGGSGTDTNLSDTYNEADAIDFFDLPFSFRFYGIPYEQVGICTNGFICFTATGQSTFRNWPIPGPKGPSPMIAAMWDDLRTTGGRILTHFDANRHAFVIEWSNCQHSIQAVEETFEIILYDPAFYPNTSMNGPVKIQYKVFNNIDTSSTIGGEAQGNYCTIGLEDASGRIGLQYAYNNAYPTAAKPILNETAIFFTGIPVIYEGSYLVMNGTSLHDANGSGFIDAGERVNLGVYVNNLGQGPANNVHAVLAANDPYITVQNGLSDYHVIPGGGSSINSTFFTFTASADCPDNHLADFILQLTDDEDTWSYYFSIRVYRPQVSLQTYLINDATGNQDGIPDPGETITLAVSLVNPSRSIAHNLTGVLSTQSTYLQIINDTVDFGVLEPGQSIQRVYQIQLDPSAPSQTGLPMILSVIGDNNLAVNIPITLGVSVVPDILEEHFDQWLPDGWSIDEYASNWSQQPNANAGGDAPEVQLTWSPSWNGISRLMTPAMNLMGATNVTISFKHYFDIFQQGGFVIGFGARTEETDWQALWEVSPSDNIGPETINLDIPPALVGEPGLQFCFFLDGNVYNIDCWAIDDVVMSATQGNSGRITGTVSLLNGPGRVEDTRVSAGVFTANPDSTGAYSLYVSPGNYPDFTAEQRFYEPSAYHNLDISFSEELNDFNFTLAYMPPPGNPGVDLIDNVLSLNWTYAPPDTRHTRDERRTEAIDRLAFQCFEIWRQVDCGPFEMIDSTNTMNWSETIDTTLTHRYYLVARYDNGVSDSTRHVAQTGSTAQGDHAQPPRITRLNGNYPNPFNPDTRIDFSLAERSPVSLTVYNLRGQAVRRLLKHQVLDAGTHQILWNGRDDEMRPLSSGVYLYRFEAGKTIVVRKATLLK